VTGAQPGHKRVGHGSAPILALDGITKRYGALTALEDVSLAVNRGEVVCLIGPSGSGKSTLLRCANALEILDGGRIVFEGREVNANDPRNARAVRQRMGMVFQNFELFPHLTVLRNITIGPTTVLKLDAAAAEQRARTLLAKVGLSDKAAEHPAALSGGQQQRVAIARALVSRPTVVFADEPTGNLDSATSGEILELVRHSVDAYGQTTVMVTHDARAAEMADRVLFLGDGLIVKEMPRSSAHEILMAMEELNKK